MARHSFPSSFGQCRCKWCREPINSSNETCRVKDDMRDALVAFAKANGRTWKTKLYDAFMDGNYNAHNIDGIDTSALQRFRNAETAGLKAITPTMLKIWEDGAAHRAKAEEKERARKIEIEHAKKQRELEDEANEA